MTNTQPLLPPSRLIAAAFALLVAAVASSPGAASTGLDELVGAHRQSRATLHALLRADPTRRDEGSAIADHGGAWIRVAGEARPADGCPALLRHAFTPIQGGPPQSLCQYQGKVVLVVNTASQCGFTYQYEGLEALYRKYRDRGLVVVGFPSNDFGGQEPGANKEIAEFCRTKYGVQFPMFEKLSVTSLADNALYAALHAKTGDKPRWNFHKYLIDRQGARVESFASGVEPGSRELVGAIERLLAERAPANRS
jgi:glutathione peroxidase